jgi:uncharacterized phage protein gp47/JayE
MPFPRPTLAQLATNIKAGFQAAIAGADLALRRSNLAISSILLAGAVNTEYGYLDWAVQNCLLPDSAIGPYADRWGNFKNVRRKGAFPAIVTAAWTGTINGTDIPAGTVLQLQPGITYATTVAAVLAAGAASLTARAILPSPPDPSTDASQWNAGVGATLSLVQAIPGIAGTGTVTALVTEGVSAESDAVYRPRYLLAYRQPPQGGDQEDYVEWAEAVPIVTRAWAVGCGFGAGTVAVYFMCDLADAYQGFPQGTNGAAASESRWPAASGDQLTLANALYAKRPVTALVVACAPVATPQNFTFKYVPVGSQAAVLAAVASVLIAEGQADGTTGIDPDDIRTAIRAVPGCATAQMQVPNDEITTPVGQLPTVGTPTWL